MRKSAGATACVAALTFAAPAGAAEALAIPKQGYFLVGGKYAPVGDTQVMTRQAYVEYQIPEKRVAIRTSAHRSAVLPCIPHV
jgi:hypothetical protein